MKVLSSILSTMFLFAVIGFVLLIGVLLAFTSDLPDYKVLEKYSPPVTTRLFAGDGRLLMEYAAEKRFFVPIEKIPERVKQSFISAEDQHFYIHPGIDALGVMRAVINNLKNVGSGKRPTGASTITQQVAKNFLLSSEVSYTRKIKEAILATRIDSAFTKDHILELYLNQIYLGNYSYGVAAAAMNYFGKSLEELTLEEAAYLAALPKGPNNYNPKTKYDAAIARRNWVISRMLDDGYINEQEALEASEAPLVTVEKENRFLKHADYFSEEVRREITNTFGDGALYEGGLIVRTTLNPELQEIATKTFRNGIKAYDRAHGYRGVIANIEDENELQSIEISKGAEQGWKKAVVTDVDAIKALIKTADGEEGQIPMSLLKWARKVLKNQGYSDAPTKASDVLKKGDVILVEKSNEDSFELRQVPDLEGGMIVMDPHTGKVLASVGGFSFNKSQYNRSTQARRQTGSAFKPIVYLAALDNGYSPTDLILDAPFLLDQGPGLPKWKPVNYSTQFYGLTTLRQGIEKSRNLMTVRLAQDLGMDKVVEYTRKLGINNNLPPLLSMSLGAGETKLINLTNAFAMMVNGGKKINPYFIERIQDRNGLTIYKHDKRNCETCDADVWNEQPIPELLDTREQLIDPLSAYQMVSILEGVAVRGTGASLNSLGKHLAGKTGTTNDSKDAWFVGFSPDLVVGVYVGFDEPRTLGRRETAATAALPIFKEFMKEALANRKDEPFRIPRGIRLVRVNHDTGLPATPFDTRVIIEAIKPDTILDKDHQRIIGDDTNKTDIDGVERVYETTRSDSEFQLGTQY